MSEGRGIKGERSEWVFATHTHLKVVLYATGH